MKMTARHYTEINKVNKELCFEGLKNISAEKRAALEKALSRNLALTSSRNLEFCEYTVYIEGFYFKFQGTRCCFSVFFRDNDGELEQIRKPNESKMKKLYDGSFKCDEADFYNIK